MKINKLKRVTEELPVSLNTNKFGLIDEIYKNGRYIISKRICKFCGNSFETDGNMPKDFCSSKCNSKHKLKTFRK